MASTPKEGATSADVSRYLTLTDWSSEVRDSVTVFYPPGDGDVQIVLPRGSEGDVRSANGVAEAIRVIAFVEGRTVREVRANLTGGGADTIAVRLLPETPSGTAPLAAAQGALAALRGLVVGAAAALQNDSLVLPVRPPVDVGDYAGRTLFSTRPGSFVVDLTLPLTQARPVSDGVNESAQDDELALFATDEVDSSRGRDLNPYGRAVSRRIRRTINRALDAAAQVSKGDLTLGAFTEPGRGLGNSTELDALASLGGGLGTAYQVRFAESRLAPGAGPVEVVTASPVQQKVLAAAAVLIRERQTFENIELNGYVIRLVKRRPNPQAPGDVTLRCAVPELDDSINCWVHLSGEDYERALTAHHDGLAVGVTGTLEYAQSRWRLRDITDFHLA